MGSNHRWVTATKNVAGTIAVWQSWHWLLKPLAINTNVRVLIGSFLAPGRRPGAAAVFLHGEMTASENIHSVLLVRRAMRLGLVIIDVLVHYQVKVAFARKLLPPAPGNARVTFEPSISYRWPKVPQVEKRLYKVLTSAVFHFLVHLYIEKHWSAACSSTLCSLEWWLGFLAVVTISSVWRQARRQITGSRQLENAKHYLQNAGSRKIPTLPKKAMECLKDEKPNTDTLRTTWSHASSGGWQIIFTCISRCKPDHVYDETLLLDNPRWPSMIFQMFSSCLIADAPSSV